MQVGDLVKWSKAWLRGCSSDLLGERGHYKKQVGIILQPVEEPRNCWRVLWSDEDVCDVHYDYLEVICK